MTFLSLTNLQKVAGYAAMLIFVLLAASACTEQSDETALPRLAADISQTTVSGISSGAYMSGQFQMAHASIVTGAGIIAGGPYGCAKSAFSDFLPSAGAAMMSAARAVNGCMLALQRAFGVPDPELLAKKARLLASDDSIDAVDDVLNDKLYLFSGKEDRIVRPVIVKAAVDFYGALGVNPSTIKFVSNYDAGHAFITEAEGGACDISAAPYIVDCDYDQAGDMLAHFYGALTPAGQAVETNYRVFNQRPFLAGLSTHGMSDTGVVYIPSACREAAGCRIHIAFHGCGQNRAAVGDDFIKKTGFARWAETNRLIILFPQTRKSATNPQACWDWWGYTGRAFLSRSAPQITAVRRMLDQLAK